MQNNRYSKIMAAMAILAVAALSAHAEGVLIGDVVTAATTTFTAVAGLAVTALTFWVGYRVVSKFRG